MDEAFGNMVLRDGMDDARLWRAGARREGGGEFFRVAGGERAYSRARDI